MEELFKERKSSTAIAYFISLTAQRTTSWRGVIYISRDL